MITSPEIFIFVVSIVGAVTPKDDRYGDYHSNNMQNDYLSSKDRYSPRNVLNTRGCTWSDPTFLSKEIQRTSKVQCPGSCWCSFMENCLSIMHCSDVSAKAMDTIVTSYENVSDLMLIITNTEIVQLPQHVCSLQHLKLLDVSSNWLDGLPWDCLRRLTNLSHIDASGSYMQTLKRTDLDGFLALKELLLSESKIKEIEKDTFRNPRTLPKLNYVDFTHNALTSLDDWPLVLSSDRHVEVLLANNYLSKFKSQSNNTCPTNLKLDLSFNNITHFGDILEGWSLNLNTPGTIRTCLNYFNLDLRNNPLSCDCKDYAIFEAIQNITLRRYTELTCNDPPELKDQHILKTPLDQFTCRLIKDCPEECQCKEIPHTKAITVNCTSVVIDDLPQTVPPCPQNYKYTLLFSNTGLREVPFRSYLSNTSRVFLSDNRIANISHSTWLELLSVEVLYLDGNNLTRIPSQVTTLNLTNIKELKLGHNPWICDCDALPTRNWLAAHAAMLKDRDAIICNKPEIMSGVLMASASTSLFCKGPNNTVLYRNLGIGVAVSIIVLAAFVTMLIGRRAWRYRAFYWHPFAPANPDDDNREFDIFVSYANEDEEYVGEYLIPELERRGFKVCFHRVHFHPGKPITTNIEECITKSKRTLVFFSRFYTESPFSMWEFSLALEIDLRDKTSRLIVVKDAGLRIEDLNVSCQTYFKRFTYTEQESLFFWENLLYVLPAPRNVEHENGGEQNEAFLIPDPEGNV